MKDEKMQKISILASVVLTLALSGCATSPVDPAEQASNAISEAKEFFSRGDNRMASVYVDRALALTTGPAKVGTLFAQNSKMQNIYFDYLSSDIDGIGSVDYANSTFNKVHTAKESSVLTTIQVEILISKLNEKVAKGNLSGSIPFTLSDNVMAFPNLKTPDHRRAMLSRSIQKLQDRDSYSRPISEVMELAEKSGKGSPEWSTVESALPTMRFRRNELDQVARVFPEFVKLRLQQSTARVFLQVKNVDRLLADDLLADFRKNIKGIEWVNEAGPNSTTLVIERIRNDEKTSPERTETITYAQHQVNIFSAALLMPNNASYIYEVLSGSTEIEYGYGVSAISQNKLTYDELVRGKVGGSYSRCQNARIQNVFGGVNPAGFVANEDMQTRCNGNQAVRMDDLRKEVISKITTSVLKVPVITAVHEMN